MKIIGNMICYNEIDYIEPCIRSTIDYFDKMIIVEGSFKECWMVNGFKRSNDGTIEILEKLKKEYGDKIEVYFHNEDSQLIQRNQYFKYAPKENHIMILQDADEYYEESELNKRKFLKEIDKIDELKVWQVRSLVFVNNLKEHYIADYNRIWTIKNGLDYKFIEPNTILANDKEFIKIKEPVCRHLHYSYVKSAKRFKEKRNERIKLNNNFRWFIDSNNRIYSPGADIKIFEEEHPINIQKIFNK